MSSTRGHFYDMSEPRLPVAQVIPRGVGARARKMSASAWRGGRRAACAVGRASIRLAPLSLSSAALIGVLAALGPMSPPPAAKSGDYNHHLRHMELQLRLLEHSSATPYDYRYQLDRYERRLQYIEIGDKFYLYLPDSTHDARLFELITPEDLPPEELSPEELSPDELSPEELSIERSLSEYQRPERAPPRAAAH